MTRTSTFALAALCGHVRPTHIRGTADAGCSRIKDLANVEGVRQNSSSAMPRGRSQRNRDTINNSPFTKQSLTGCERLGVNIRGQTLRTGNVRRRHGDLQPAGLLDQGTRIDGRSRRSATPRACNGHPAGDPAARRRRQTSMRFSQGSLAIGGFQAEGDAAKIVAALPTVGRISNGAIIEREIRLRLNRPQPGRLAIRNAIHHRQAHRRRHQRLYRDGDARADRSPPAWQLTRPEAIPGNVVALLTEIEQLPDRAGSLRQDRHRRTLRHHRDGRDVRVSMVAVAQGNLTGDDLRSRRSASRRRSAAAAP